MRRGTAQQRLPERTGGFGLVEVLSALAVASIGVLAVAGIGLAIAAQGRLARWDTDGALAARHTLVAAAAARFGAVAGGAVQVILPPRTYTLNRTVARLSSRLEEIRVLVASPLGRAPASFATRRAATRPLPVAP